jgi:hypothetical protein
VIPLFSPPRTPGYNGAIEAGIGSLKTRTQTHAARYGRPGWWTWDDVEAARAEANATARPRGPSGPTPDASWHARRPVTPAERGMFQVTVARLRTHERSQSMVHREDPLSENDEAIVDRRAVRRALEEHGYLLYSRRRIQLPIRRQKTAGITQGAHGMKVHIRFAPNRKEVSSQEIAFVQSARIVEFDSLKPVFTSDAATDRRIKGGFFLDRFEGYASGWYGAEDNNKYDTKFTVGRSPKNYRDAEMTDTPNTPLKQKLRFEFVTAVIANEGDDKGKIYGAVNWGSWLEEDHSAAHPYGVKLLNEVPDRWINAVKEWNAQADSLLRKKNSKDQKPLGPFAGVSLKDK